LRLRRKNSGGRRERQKRAAQYRRNKHPHSRPHLFFEFLRENYANA
jgi:hypothetical protein